MALLLSSEDSMVQPVQARAGLQGLQENMEATLRANIKARHSS